MGASPYLSHLPLADVSSSLAKSTTPAVAGVFPPRMSLTPAPRASFPLAIYGEGVAVRPGVRSFPSLAFKPLDRAIVRLFLVVANAD